MTMFEGEGWLDSNADRAYPLYDAATRLDTTGLFELPNDLIVDLRIAAPASYSATAWFISQVAGYGSGLVITISVTGTGAVATATIPLDGFVEFTNYALTPLPGYPQVGGVITIGAGLAVLAAAASVYTFTQTATQLLPTIVFPTAATVSSITFVDSFGVETVLTGAVVLSAGTNASIGVVDQTITLSMDTGVLIEDPCTCTDTGGSKRTSVKSINGVTPDDDGNLQIVPVGCPAIESGLAQLILRDTCAQPCCGTPEIDALVTTATSLDQKQAELANLEAAIEASLRQLNNYYSI